MRTTMTSPSKILLACLLGFAANHCGGSNNHDAGMDGGDGGLNTDGSTFADVPRLPDGAPVLSMVTGTWHTVQGPSGDVSGVWASGPNDVYAFSGMNLLHYNGTMWDSTQDSYPIRAVNGSGPNDVWVAAQTDPAAGSADYPTPIMQHYTGGSTPAESMPASMSVFTSVFTRAPNDAWAVGAGLPFHWDGSHWTEAGMGIQSGAQFFGVWASGPTDVVIVGSNTYRWNGTTWALQTAGGGEYYAAVWGFGANEIWMVGSQSYIQHFDGDGWHDVDPQTDPNLNAVWGAAPNDVWAVGDSGLIIHWNGASWSTVDSGTMNNLRGIYGTSATDIWAVGDSGTFLHYTM
jgi:hypothetical protein